MHFFYSNLININLKEVQKQHDRSKEIEATNDLIIDGIRDIKGKNIVKLDLRDVAGAPADYFIICQGESTTQVSSIAQNIHKRLKQEMKALPIGFEGKNDSTWMLIDYFNTVVHIFHPTAREFYNLEGLWSDAKFSKYADE